MERWCIFGRHGGVGGLGGWTGVSLLNTGHVGRGGLVKLDRVGWVVNAGEWVKLGMVVLVRVKSSDEEGLEVGMYPAFVLNRVGQN